MRLCEIGENEKIQIQAKMDGVSLEYDAVVAGSKQEVLLVYPIVCEGRMMNFESAQVAIDVIYAGEEGRPVIWERCTARNITYKGEKYHVLYSKREGRRLNRRSTYRQYLGIKGMIQIDTTRATHEVIVKNVSETGVAFVSEDMSLHMDDIGSFHLSYQDRESRLNVQIGARVVREEDIDENKRVFGAVVSSTNIPLAEYIARKQKEEIARKRSH